MIDSGDHVTDSEGEENDQEQPLGEVGGRAKALNLFKVSEQAFDSGREASSQDEGEPGRKRKRFSKGKQCEKDDPMPLQYQHIRSSERKVKPVYDQTCADLTAIGLSIPESIKATCGVKQDVWSEF